MLANNRKKSFQLKNLQLSNFLIAFTVGNAHSPKRHLRMDKQGRLLSPTSPIKTLHTSHLLICLRSPRGNANRAIKLENILGTDLTDSNAGVKCSLERDRKVNHYGVKKQGIVCHTPQVHRVYTIYRYIIDTYM